MPLDYNSIKEPETNVYTSDMLDIVNNDQNSSNKMRPIKFSGILT